MSEFSVRLSTSLRVMSARQGAMVVAAAQLMLGLVEFPAYAGAPFVPMAHYPSGGAAQYTANGDVNADGKTDVFASNSNGVISVLLGNGNGSFQAPKTIAALPAGSYPIVAADFNRDGNPDLAVLEPAKASVLIYFGNGDGTFRSARTIAIGNTPQHMIVGDMNGDGYPDLVFSAGAGTGASATVGFTLLLSQGSGNFHAPSYVVAKNGGAGGVMAAGDLNHDGRLDLVTCNGNGWAEAFLGNGNGTFREQAAFDDGLSEIGESQLLLADFYGNGKLDLVIGNFGFQEFSVPVVLWEGVGDGTFSALKYLTAGYHPAWFAAADMNGDGNPDLVVANSYSNSVTVLINQKAGNFTSTPDNYATPMLLGGPGPGPMTVGDFNGDKKPDVVVGTAIGVDVLLNLRGGVLNAPASVEVGVLTASEFAADLNSDGHLDLAVQTFGFGGNVGAVNALFGDGRGNLTGNYFTNGTFMLPETVAQYSILAGGYFNGNGKVGAAAWTAGQIAQSYNNGKGFFTQGPPIDLPQIGIPNYYCAGDFNGDGYSDLALVYESNEVDIYINKRDGTYSSPTTYKVGVQPRFIMQRDLNHDGKVDLITANYGSNDVSVLLGKGNGTFAPAKEYPAGSKPNVVASGDFNRDSQIDLAVGGSGQVAILKGRGDGTFAAAASYPAHAPVTYLAVAGLNGNGVEDILTVSTDFNNLHPQYMYLLAGKGDGTFGPSQAFAAGSNPYWLAVGDFNEDGAPDLVVTNWFESPTANLFLNRRGTRISLKSSMASVHAGNPITFTATLSASVLGSSEPTGMVAFKDGTKSIGTAQLVSGKATLTLKLSLGHHTISASYWGNGSFNPHVSAPVTVAVQ